MRQMAAAPLRARVMWVVVASDAVRCNHDVGAPARRHVSRRSNEVGGGGGDVSQVYRRMWRLAGDLGS